MAEIQQKLNIGDDGKKVYLEVHDHQVSFDPPTAIAMAEALLNAATECGYQVHMNRGAIRNVGRSITDAERAGLITRCAHIMRSMQAMDTHVTAVHVVDTVLIKVL